MNVLSFLSLSGCAVERLEAGIGVVLLCVNALYYANVSLKENMRGEAFLYNNWRCASTLRLYLCLCGGVLQEQVLALLCGGTATPPGPGAAQGAD